jgi:hypothetical protein
MNYREVLIRLLSMTSPYVYDDEESFLQLMRKFYKMLHELVEATKHLSDDVAQVKIDMAKLDKKLDDLIEDINKQLEEFNLKIEATKKELKLYTDNAIVNLRAYVDLQDANINERITRIETGDIQVYDPTTGLLSPIQTVINNLYESSRENALTASEYDALELTATTYDSKQLTAFDFDTNGKTLLSE